MSYQSDFAADPIAFMNKHVLIPSFPQYFETGGLPLSFESSCIPVAVSELASSRLLNPPQNDSKVFRFTSDLTGLSPQERLELYYLPYKPDNLRFGVLRTASTWMFTAAMTGCTLGLGSQGADGSCLVTHANNVSIGGKKGREAQGEAQLKQTAEFFSGLGEYAVMTPAEYRGDTGGLLNWSAANFAVRTGNRWKMMTHKYKQRTGEAGLKTVAAGGTADFYHGGQVVDASPIPPPPRIRLGGHRK